MSNPLSSRYDSDRDSPGFMLWRVTNRWQAVIRVALRPFRLTHVQFVLLAALTWAMGELTQIELAHGTRTDPMMTSQVLRALERKGLIERREHPTDGRARLLNVTPAGAERPGGRTPLWRPPTTHSSARSPSSHARSASTSPCSTNGCPALSAIPGRVIRAA